MFYSLHLSSNHYNFSKNILKEINLVLLENHGHLDFENGKYTTCKF